MKEIRRYPIRNLIHNLFKIMKDIERNIGRIDIFLRRASKSRSTLCWRLINWISEVTGVFVYVFYFIYFMLSLLTNKVEWWRGEEQDLVPTLEENRVSTQANKKLIETFIEFNVNSVHQLYTQCNIWSVL